MTERASDWLKANFDWDKSGRGYIRKSDNRLTLLSDCMDEFSRERVLAELREACKVMCKFCERDCALDEAGGHVHLCCAREGLHYIADCTASPIRQRIATLEAGG